MKGIRTLRGTITGSTKKEIFTNDLKNVGWIVKKFCMWPNDMDANPYVAGKLWIGDDDGGSLQFSGAGDNRAIGWAAAGGGGPPPATNIASLWNLLDPDHIVTEALHVINHSTASAAYLVELEYKPLTDAEEIMSLIKQRSQDDL